MPGASIVLEQSDVRDSVGCGQCQGAARFARPCRKAPIAPQPEYGAVPACGDGITHIALFEDERRAGHGTTVALRTDGAGFIAFSKRASRLPLFDKRRRPSAPRLQDHDQSLSLYFNDPDGNPVELTTYEVIAARLGLRA